jgi:hypothetical protein
VTQRRGEAEERGSRGEETQRRGDTEERRHRGEETQRRGDTEERRGDQTVKYYWQSYVTLTSHTQPASHGTSLLSVVCDINITYSSGFTR